MGRFDTVLMGRPTFETAAAQAGGGAMPGMKAIVVSSAFPATSTGRTTQAAV